MPGAGPVDLRKARSSAPTWSSASDGRLSPVRVPGIAAGIDQPVVVLAATYRPLVRWNAASRVPVAGTIASEGWLSEPSVVIRTAAPGLLPAVPLRSEEHTSELQ